MTNIIYERFESINSLLNTINNRPNNRIMKKSNDSQEKGKKYFYGTDTYKDACKLLVNGWDEPLKELETQLKKSNTFYSKSFKPIPRNAVVGFIPNVPNALRNIPQSMITINRIPQKVKTISIYYSNTASGSTSKKTFVENGIKILNLVNKLESQNIRVNVYSVLYYAEKYTDLVFVPVKIKDFRDKLDLKKICFPIAHAAWLRRIGFKWLETAKGLTSTGWPCGYGRCIVDDDDHEKYTKLLIQRKILNPDDLFFTFYQVSDDKFSDKYLR